MTSQTRQTTTAVISVSPYWAVTMVFTASLLGACGGGGKTGTRKDASYGPDAQADGALISGDDANTVTGCTSNGRTYSVGETVILPGNMPDHMQVPRKWHSRLMRRQLSSRRESTLGCEHA